MSFITRCCFIFFWLITFITSSALPCWAQSSFDLTQLMQTLAQVKSGEASFVENRHVAMLERTLQSTGTLSFAAPDTFVRTTLKPRTEKLAVIGNNVTMSLGTRSRTVALSSVPEAAVIVEAIRGTLTGNRETLERHFKASASGTAQRWSLELLPREAHLRELVVAVRVQGAQAEVREVSVSMADGDSSVMTITPLKAIKAAGSAAQPNTAPPSAARRTTP
jgi:hypothetical protein